MQLHEEGAALTPTTSRSRATRRSSPILPSGSSMRRTAPQWTPTVSSRPSSSGAISDADSFVDLGRSQIPGVAALHQRGPPGVPRGCA